jgi:molybdate transport system substrate-binding protein
MVSSLSIPVAIAFAGAGLLVTGCAGADDTAAEETTVTVLAAASLTESFTAIGAAFEQANPGVRVAFSFGPSSGLVSQVIEGAPADILATADTATMQTAVDAGVVAAPRGFASNSLAVVVPAANPAGIVDLAGLAEPGVLVAVCEPQVPCGAVAQEVIAASGLPIEPVTFDIDVKAVLTKVILDEVDAGMVYATDVRAAGDDVIGIDIPADISTSVTYSIAGSTTTSVADLTGRFLDFVMGAPAQRILAQAGFGSP